MKYLYFFIVLAFGGCASSPHSHALIKKGSPEIQQQGDAKIPSAASVYTTVSVLPLPAGSIIKNETPSPQIITLSQPSELKVETRTERVEGAKTPEPSPPPSPQDLARASGIKWFYFAGIACGLAAVFLIWRGYPFAAKSFIAGAVALPLFGNLVSEKWAIVAAGICCVSGLVFIIAWKIIAAKHQLFNNAV